MFLFYQNVSIILLTDRLLLRMSVNRESIIYKFISIPTSPEMYELFVLDYGEIS